MTEGSSDSGGLEPGAALRRFLHDLATPLSAVGLHLERAHRQSGRGEDPTEALAVARQELDRVFDLFERGRETLLAPDRPGG